MMPAGNTIENVSLSSDNGFSEMPSGTGFFGNATAIKGEKSPFRAVTLSTVALQFRHRRDRTMSAPMQQFSAGFLVSQGLAHP
jgi:hypothetical protein